MSKSRAECLRILGLPSTASDKEIKDAYRKKALELHPDKNPEDREAATKRFQEVQEAYTSLVKEDDDEEIPEWLRMIIIMRERERRRRQFEQFMFGFGGMFNPFAFGFHDHYYDEDDDDEYEYYQDILGNIYRRKRRPRRRYNHDHWRSDDFEHYSNNTSSSRPNQYPGSDETNKNSSSGHEAKVDSPNPSPEWLPKQPKQPTTRSAKQKKKKGKKNKNKKKRGHTSVRNVKEMKNNCAGQDSDSDEESVSSTIDSMDSYYNSEELEEEEEGDDDEVSKNTRDSEKKENDYETNDNLSPEKLGNKEKKNNSREDLAFENECFTTENGCKINSRTEKTDQEKVKVEDTGVGGNMCNDNTSEPSQGDNNVKFENKENDTRTSKKTSQKNFSAKGEYRGTHKIIDESIFKETTNTFCKKETDEEDWSNWKFPRQHVNSTDIKKGAEDATKTTHQGRGKEEAKPINKERNGDELLNTGKRGKENIPKTPDKGQGREEVTPSSNGKKGGDKERSGLEDPNLTNKEKAGKVPQSTNGGRDGEETSKPSELGEKKVPKGTFGCQNGQTRPSDEGFQYEIIKKRYGGYIKKHSDPALTGRIKKLIDITTQDK